MHHNHVRSTSEPSSRGCGQKEPTMHDCHDHINVAALNDHCGPESEPCEQEPANEMLYLADPQAGGCLECRKADVFATQSIFDSRSVQICNTSEHCNAIG